MDGGCGGTGGVCHRRGRGAGDARLGSDLERDPSIGAPTAQLVNEDGASPRSILRQTTPHDVGEVGGGAPLGQARDSAAALAAVRPLTADARDRLDEGSAVLAIRATTHLTFAALRGVGASGRGDDGPSREPALTVGRGPSLAGKGSRALSNGREGAIAGPACRSRAPCFSPFRSISISRATSGRS